MDSQTYQQSYDQCFDFQRKKFMHIYLAVMFFMRTGKLFAENFLKSELVAS